MANRAWLRTIDTLLPEYLENPFPEAADSKTLPAAASPAFFALSLLALPSSASLPSSALPRVLLAVKPDKMDFPELPLESLKIL